jgi:hypothetical protein
MSNFSTATQRFAGRGKFPARDLLPLIPPTAELSEQSAVKPHQLGKIPGRFRGGKWTGLAGPWPTLGLSERDRHLSADWPTANVGLRAADWPAVDCDIENPQIAQWTGRRVKQMLGFAPVRTRGNSPRCLYMFRRADEDAIRKMQLIFVDPDGEEHKVEILGAGQQYVVAGMHPSGVAYEWADPHPADVTTDGLTQVTEAQLREFLETLANELQSRGCSVTRLALPSRGSGAQGHGSAVNDLDPVVDAELALAALHTFKNDADTVPSREQIIAICASFKAALGREADQHFDAFKEWATADGWADDEYITGIWESLTYIRTGPEYLFAQARRTGWRGDVVLDFGAPAQDETNRPVVEAAQAEADEERAQLRELASKLVYWPQATRWIVRGTGETLSYEGLNRYPGLGTMIADAGASGRKTASNMLVNSGLVTQVAGVTYLPAKDVLTSWTHDGRTALYYNRWHDAQEVLPDSVTDADIRTWLDHVEYLFPDSAERGVLFDWMAHCVQKRGVKIRWAPLIIGGQGVGKDLMILPLARYLAHNYSEVGPDRLFQQFNGFLERELIVVQEMSRFDKIDAYEKLKALVAGTAGGTVRVEKKFQEAYEIPNVTNFLFFSNHTDAVRIEADDRRFFVMQTDAQPKSPDYYANLSEQFYMAQSGWRKVIRWLMQRDLSVFKTHQCPPPTDAKQQMYDEQQPYFHLWMRDQLTQGRWANRSIVAVSDVLTTVQTDYTLDLPTVQRQKVHSLSVVTRALSFSGWHGLGQVRVQNGERKSLWSRDREYAAKQPAEIRDIYLDEEGKAA